MRKADFCGEYTSFSEEQQTEDELLLAELARSHGVTRDDHFLMGQCINATVMDGLFERACCGYTSSPTSPTTTTAGVTNPYSSVDCDDFQAVAPFPSDDDDGSSLLPPWFDSNGQALNWSCPLDVNGAPYPRLSSLLGNDYNGYGQIAERSRRLRDHRCEEDPSGWNDVRPTKKACNSSTMTILAPIALLGRECYAYYLFSLHGNLHCS